MKWTEAKLEAIAKNLRGGRLTRKEIADKYGITPKQLSTLVFRFPKLKAAAAEGKDILQRRAAKKAAITRQREQKQEVRSKTRKPIVWREVVLKELFRQQKGLCPLCKYRHAPPRAWSKLQVDHIIPRVKGGQDLMENLQMTCAHCNRKKGGRWHQ